MLDRDLQALLERADPVGRDAGPAEETERALERVWRRIDAGPTARPGRRMGAAAALAGAAAVAGAAVLAGGAGDGRVATASAAEIVHRALGALGPAPILHMDVVGIQTGPAVRWEDEQWSLQAPPYDVRQVETDGQGHAAESAVANGRGELYDAGANTIFRAPRPKIPRYDIRSGTQPGTYRLTVPATISFRRLQRVIQRGGTLTGPGMTKTLTITAAQRRELLAGQATVQWRLFRAGGSPPRAEDPYVAPVPKPQRPETDYFRAQARRLLRSLGVRVDEHARLGGRRAIRIASANERTVYFVAPGTFTPLELRTRGRGGSVTLLRFRAYEQLSDTPAHRRLVSLAAQHPGATVDTDPAHYNAAERRLFPHG